MLEIEGLNDELSKVKMMVYDQCSLLILDLMNETEGKEYKACRFKLNGLNIICRTGKITPKKIGQFVTFWKRNKDGVTVPFEETDLVDFYVINVCKEGRIGQFIFPKYILLKKAIMSTLEKDGKRGFRIYPIWDSVDNKQAKRTQKWQLNYFVEYDDKTDLKSVQKLFDSK